MKTCAECGKHFGPRPGEKSWHFKHRKTCCPDCAQAQRTKYQKAKSAARKIPAGPKPVMVRKPYTPQVCAHCGVEYHPRPTENMSNYRRRITCSVECGQARSAQSRGVKIYAPPQTKTCVYCGSEFNKTPHESRAKWEKRMFCSRECANEHNQPAKHCLQCGARIHTKGKYCSPLCAHVHKFGDPERLPSGFVERFAAHNGLTVEGASRLLGVAI